MNALALTFRAETSPYDGIIYVSARLLVDGIDLISQGDGVDLTELLASMDGDGEFFILTCGCGDAGCGGYFEGVRVRHERGIHWELPGRSVSEPARQFEFSSSGYTSAIKSGIAAGKQLVHALLTTKHNVYPCTNHAILGDDCAADSLEAHPPRL